MDDNCCEAWLKAQEPETDNEAYSWLLDKDLDGNWTIGSYLPPVKFCPWCGKAK